MKSKLKSQLTKESIAIHRRLLNAKSEQEMHLWLFGDFLAQREGYRSVDGIEAVQLYLVLKHHWLPRDVRSMATDDLLFALHVELQDWTLPKDVLEKMGK